MTTINRPEDIGPAVRSLRQAAGLSQFDLSERCGITAKDIGRIERGGQIPLMSTFIRLVRGCERTVSVD